MKTQESAAFWKAVAMALISAVVSGASAWLVFGEGTVGREEVSKMILTESPYIADRRLIADRLEANTKLLEKISADVAGLKVEEARLSEKVDVLIKEGRR